MLVKRTLLVALVPWWLSLAHAQQPTLKPKPVNLGQRAANHFEVGSQAYQAGQFDVARVEFEASYQHCKEPDLLHNLSMVAEQQGKFAEALALEREFLAKAQLKPEERESASNRIARLSEQIPPQQSPAQTSSAPTPPGKTARIVSIAGLAVGGGLLVSAIGIGGAALALKNDLESRPITLTELDQGRALGQSYQSAAIGLGVVGGVLVIGSTVGVVVASRRRP